MSATDPLGFHPIVTQYVAQRLLVTDAGNIEVAHEAILRQWPALSGWITEPTFDSTSVRLSWNPTERWALQASWADLESPEQLEPDVDETRWSVSAAYTMPLGEESYWSTTFIYGEKDPSDEESLAGLAIETAYRPNPNWTFFARGEQVDSHDLAPDVETVAKVSIGAIRDFRLRENVTFGVGALYSRNFVPGDLEPAYGGDPDGAMGFVRLRIGG